MYISGVSLSTHLLVNSDGVKPAIHDADPSIFGREDEERHQRSAQIVKIVFLVEPQIAGIGKALSLVHHMPHVRTVTVVELTFEKVQLGVRAEGVSWVRAENGVGGKRKKVKSVRLEEK